MISTPATSSTRHGPKSSGTTCGCRGRLLARPLNGDPLERLRVAEAALLPHLAVPLAHPLLYVPLPPGLGNLALVLLQGFDLQVEGRRDVDQVVARGPVRDPDLFDDVRLEAFLEQASKGARVARVRVHRGHRRLA